MDIQHPVFLVPSDQFVPGYKRGGHSAKFFGDPNKFETHKRVRGEEIDQLLRTSHLDTPVKAPKQKIFFALELEKGATAKSQQPTPLLDKFNIDLELQQTETLFYAATDEANLTEFRSTVSGLRVDLDADDAAYLTAIKKISNIPTKAKIEVDLTSDKKEYVGFLYLHPSLSDAESKEVYKTIARLKGSRAKELEYFVSPSGSKIIYGSYGRNELGELVDSAPTNPVLRFEESQTFIVPSSMETYHVMDDTEIVKPELDAKVGILDTGMTVHDIYRDLVLQQQDYITGRNSDESRHATIVGTRAIFGNNIQEMLDNGNRLFAQVSVLDFRVLAGEGPTHDKIIVDAVEKILNKHSGDVKVYNLSFNNSDIFNPSAQKAYISRELDALAHKHNVLLVCSAGNSYEYSQSRGNLGYPDCVLDDEAMICPPADGVNLISVGSLADSESSRSLAKNNEPSPFTRHGTNKLWKPDLIHYGGNIDKHGRASGIGVEGFSQDHNRIAEDAGTSFSAPLVSQVAAKLYAYLQSTGIWKQRPVALTKALLLHSAFYDLPPKSMVPTSRVRQLVGFGVPDYQRALDSSQSSATFIATGLIGEPMKSDAGNTVKGSKQRIQFTVPEELKGKNKRVRIKGTLVYMSPVSSSGGIDYTEARIEVNLHYLNSKGKMVPGSLTQTTSDYRLKWNPVQAFEKTCQAFDGGTWEVWLNLTTRGSSETPDYTQEYALIITVEDVSPDIDARVDIQNIIETKHKQYVRLRPQTQVKQSVRAQV